MADQQSVQAILETTRTLIVSSAMGTTGAVGTTGSPPATTSGTPSPPPSTTGNPFGTSTFCSKYAAALGLSQYNLVSAVVNATTVKLVTPPSPNKIYFDGTKPPGSTNFLDPNNAAQLVALQQGLVAFFGQMGVLGCNDPAFPAYTGPTDMKALHAPMMITQSDSDAFNQALVSTIQGFGVTNPTDIGAVNSLLAGQAPNIISGFSATPAAGPPSGASSNVLQPWQIGVIAAVGLSVLVAVIVTIVCCIRRQGKEGGQYVAF